MKSAETHFDHISKQYDYWKNKNRFYYDNLKALLSSKIVARSRVLEIGCGTGDLLKAVNPGAGLGIDISAGMIEIAQKRHADSVNLRFERIDIFSEPVKEEFDYIFMCDVLEHVEDNKKFVEKVSALMGSQTRLIVTLANPLWEPVLMLAEKLKMKMPEGPHYRLPTKKLDRIFLDSGLKIIEKNYRLLIPKRVPFAAYINEKFYKNWLLARGGFIIFWVLEKS